MDLHICNFVLNLSAVDQIEGQEHSALFIWRGRHSQISEQDLSPPLTIQSEPRVVINEGQEPSCFLQLFQGGLVIHRGHSSNRPGKTPAK